MSYDDYGYDGYGYDELLNVFDDQGLGPVGETGWDPDMQDLLPDPSPPLPLPVPRLAPPLPPAPVAPRDLSLAGVATASLLAGVLFGVLFGRP